MSSRKPPIRGHVRRSDYVRLSHGLHVPIEATTAPSITPVLEAWSLLLPPSGCFTSVTAAGRYGWSLPALPPDKPVFIAMDRAETRPKRPGLRVSRHPEPPQRRVWGGLPLATPAEALLAAARDLALLDMAILLDSAMHNGWCTRLEVAAVCAGRKGGPALRRTLAIADARAESAWETVLRIFHDVCDVPVVPQHELRAPDGAFIARGDLWLRGTRVLHEYDGGVHRDKEQHRRDLARDRAVANAGWLRRGYTAVDLLRRPEQILREADASLGRRHEPGRLEAWRALLVESTMTEPGRARLRARWKLD